MAPAFQERVTSHQAELSEAVRTRGIASVITRVRALDNRWRSMQRVIEARGEELAGETAGGETGLLVRTEKVIGTGDKATKITEYALDAGMLTN